jgi:predicted butyrate kinase (DUF1464 family)
LPRVIGIDPGTVTVDLCGLDDGTPFLDVSLPTTRALQTPSPVLELIETTGVVDLVAGPSGYGLPIMLARDLTEQEIRLACLTAAGESGGIGGLGALLRALARSAVPVVLTPGVVHLPSVPAHRKVNRVDMGTADKVCAVVLAIKEQMERRECTADEVSLVLLELGGAFSAAVAVEGGRIVDGLGGTSGPLGVSAAGALDGEVAFLAGRLDKDRLFHGGALAIAGAEGLSGREFAQLETPRGRVAWDAYVESAVKAVATMMVAVPRPFEIVVSGRMAAVPRLREALEVRLKTVAAHPPIRTLEGFASVATHAAQGAALVADGLAGGRFAGLIEALEIGRASGTVLDHLYFISPGEARKRLGI